MRLLCYFAFLILVTGCTPLVFPDQVPEFTPAVKATVGDPTVLPARVSTYVSQSDRFSIQYPATHTLFLDEIPGVDGVKHPLPGNAIAILSPASPNFLLTIEHVSLTDAPSLDEFTAVTGQNYCDLEITASQEVLIGTQRGLLFPDLPCGPYGSSLLFILYGNDGYVMTVEAHRPYDEVSNAVMEIISTFQYLGTPL